MGPLAELMKHLEVESATQGDSDRHSKPSMQKDMEVMIDQLMMMMMKHYYSSCDRCINIVINGQSKLSICAQLSVPIGLCLLQACVVLLAPSCF